MIIVENNQIIKYQPESAQDNLLKLTIITQNSQRSIEKINLDHVQTIPYHFQSNVQFIIKVHFDPLTSQRYLIVSSKFLIQNCTQYILNFSMQKTDGKSIKFQARPFDNQEYQISELHDNQAVIPFGYEDAKFDISIQRTKDQQSSSSSLLLKDLMQSQGQMRSLLFPNINLNICCRNDPLFPERFIVYIQPPMTITNNLPIKFQYQLYDGKQFTVLKSLQPQQSSDEHPFLEKKPYQIRLYVEGFLASPNLDLPVIKDFDSKDTKDWCKFLIKGEPFTGSNGGQTHLFLTNDKESFKLQGKCNVLVRCAAYIKNESPYDYLIFQSNKKKIELLGGQKQANKILLLNPTEEDSELKFADRTTPQISSRAPSQIHSVGQSQSDLYQIKNQKHYVVPLSIYTELKIIKTTNITKVITVSPRIIIINHCSNKIGLRRSDNKNYDIQDINVNQRLPLIINCIYSNEDIQKISFNMSILDGKQWNWSGPINFNTIGIINFQLRSIKDETVFSFYNVDIREYKACLYVIFSNTNESQVPYKITNLSTKNNIMVESLPILLESHLQKECQFAWDDYVAQKQRVKIQIYPLTEQHKPLDYEILIDKVGQVEYLKLQSTDQKKVKDIYLKMKVLIEGYTKHVIFTDSSTRDYNQLKKTDKMDFLGPSNKHQYEEIQYDHKKKISQIQQQEIQQSAKLIKLRIALKIQALTINLIDNSSIKSHEILNVSFTQSEIILIISQTDSATLQAKIKSLQIDNNSKVLPIYPVILSMIPLKANLTMPMINCLIQADLTAKNVQLVDKFILETSPIQLQIDYQLINELNDFYEQINDAITKVQDQFQHLQYQKSEQNEWEIFMIPERQTPTYIKQITILPLPINLTLYLLQLKTTANQNVFFRVAQEFGVKFIDLDEAKIKFSALQIDDCFDTIEGIGGKMKSHYKWDVLKQFYKIFGSLNIIGNPIGLFSNVATGVQDMIERPIEGIIQGPLEAGLGIVTGATSLVQHTIAGAFNSVQTIVGSVSSGISLITFDNDYMSQRQKQKEQKAKNITQGIAKGSKHIFSGLYQGVTGVVTKPAQGLKQGGAGGLFKGIWQGVSGLVVKPVAGVLDAASKTSEGIKNQFQSSVENIRVRPIRAFYGRDYHFKNYQIFDAEAYELLQSQKNGKYSNSIFRQSHMFSWNNKDYLLVLAQELLLLFDKSNKRQQWSIEVPSITEIKKLSNSTLLIQYLKKQYNFKKQKQKTIEVFEIELIDTIYNHMVNLLEKEDH